MNVRAISLLEIRSVQDTRTFFSNIGLWPDRLSDINPQGWMKNFHSDLDRQIAASLLDSYLLISTDHALRMVRSAFHSLSVDPSRVFTSSFEEIKADWNSFRTSMIVSFPENNRDPGSSGYIFARFARELVVNPETQILEPAAAVARIANSESPVPVVFVDDFSGSGTQFLKTWIAEHEIGSAGQVRFKDLAAQGRISETIFVPAVATSAAKSEIAYYAPEVRVRPANLLPPQYSATAPNTCLVPPKLREELPDFFRRHAAAAGYDPDHPLGFNAGGFAISFEHSTPDNTLRIFNGGPNRSETWRPLRSK